MAHTAVGLIAGLGDDDLVPAPGVGKRLKITGIYLDANTVLEMSLKSGASGTNHIGNSTVGITLNTVTQFNPTGIIFLCDENAPLTLDRFTSVEIVGIITHETVNASDT